MQRGDIVIVRAYPNKQLERVVWEEHKTYVLVCRSEIYIEAIKQGVEPESSMGFPTEDVMVVSDNNRQPNFE